MTTREWHELVKPVLPHTLKDADFPELSHIRVELGARSLYAVATDRYTLAAERHPLARADRNSPMPPVHVPAPDIAASLKLFARPRARAASTRGPRCSSRARRPIRSSCCSTAMCRRAS